MEKQIDSTTIYDGAIMKVTKEHVLLQDGNEIARETVTTPYSYTFESDEEGNALPEFNIVDNKNYSIKQPTNGNSTCIHFYQIR